MSFGIKVAATGVIALCLVISAVLFISSATMPTLQSFGDKFFGLAIVLIIVFVFLGVVGIKIRLP